MKNHNFTAEIITSRTNSTIVKIGKLSNKKYRHEDKLFICDGVKLVKEAIDFSLDIKYIVIRDDFALDSDLENSIISCQKNGTLVLCVSSQVYEKISEESAPQGIMAVCSFITKKHKNLSIPEPTFDGEKIIMVESVRDPGNIGTMLRNACAFGIDRLIFSKDCADFYSQKVVRAAMGALFKMRIDVVDDFVGSINSLKECGKNVYGAALNENSLILGQKQLSSDDVIIIGNEGHGLSSDVLSAVDDTIFIPIQKNTESLNAAMASAIFMWELSK